MAFSGAMFGLVTSDNMLLLYLFWELTSVLSFLLVGHYAERATSRRAAMQALLVTTFGGLAMLVGIVVVGNAAGTYLLSELVAAPPHGLAVGVSVVLILVGALSKSAIVPFHFWLPGAMAAPTPVSAYLHAAAMVKAGVYLIARLAPGSPTPPDGGPTVIGLGLLTMLMAGWRAVREYDLKLILAFGTVSQLGFITVMVGGGGRDLMLAGLAMLCAHALFKAALFMVVGVIDHSTGTRDIRKLAWLGPVSRRCSSSRPAPPRVWLRYRHSSDSWRRKPISRPSRTVRHWADGLPGARRRGSRVGVHHHVQPPILVGAFARKGFPQPSKLVARLHLSRWCSWSRRRSWLRRGLTFGLAPGLLNWMLDGYVDTVPAAGPTDGGYTLELWHGFGLPILLSAVVLTLGTVAFFSRDRLRRLGVTPGPPTGQCGPHLRCDPSRGRPAVVATHRLHSEGLHPGHPGGDPVHAGPCFRWRC